MDEDDNIVIKDSTFLLKDNMETSAEDHFYGVLRNFETHLKEEERELLEEQNI